MRFEHRFTVRASQEAVAEFHSHASGLRALTPPPAIMRLHDAPDPLTDGTDFSFTLWMGPFPVVWESLIREMSVEGFTDLQGRKGPFRLWRHRHSFRRIDDQTTEVHDSIEAELRPHLYHGPSGLAMWLTLPLLFRFRAGATRRALEGST
jgi:ligand-binding SRPBCC domain-containing protein